MGRIYPDADHTYFSKHERFGRFVQPFLSCFDITRAWQYQHGADFVVAIYLKPETFIAELTGLERELLLVYAPFPEFQARTLKLHDELLERDRLRLDPLGSIVVADAPDTRQRVHDYLMTQLERPPIVALSTAELEQLKCANDIRSVLLEQLFRRDLFALESPLRTDASFFGRQEVTSTLVDRFRSAQNSGLFGLRRIGKTSVLYGIQRRCDAAGLAASPYVDLSNPGLYKARWWELLQELALIIAKPLELERGDRSKLRAATVKYTETDGAKHFRADIDHLLKLVLGSKILMLLDEVEHITVGISPADHWNSDFLPFWQTVRSVHQDRHGALCFVVAGVNPRCLEIDRVGTFDNPLFSTARSFYLGPFDKESVREMARRLGRHMGIRFEENVYEALHSEYGGHPFLVRQACSQLAAQMKVRPGGITLADFERAKSSIAVQLDRNVRQILNVLAIWYPNEFELMRSLAKGDIATFVEFAKANAGFTEHVEGYGLVRGARDSPQIPIVLVRSHLAKLPEAAVDTVLSKASPEEILAEISRRRNAIEIKLRIVAKQALQYGLGKKAADAVLSGLDAKRREILAQYGYEGVWQHLYLKELATILDKQYACFQNYFGEDKSKVLEWLEHVNRIRADAHAKSVSDEDLAYLRVCFHRLEELVSK